METKKNSFVLYTEFYEVMKDLTDAQIGKLHRAIYIYQLEGKVIDLDPALAMAFKFVKVQLDKNQAKWEEQRNKRSDAGKKHKGNQYTKMEQMEQVFQNGTNGTNGTVNVNVNVNDNVDVNNKKENNIKEKKKKLPQTQQPSAITPVKVVKKSPQQRVFDYFADRYQAMTGLKYLSKRSEFINLTDLIHKNGEELVKQKIQWFEIGCLNGVFWFSKNINSFTIGNLVRNWNEIMPILTEEQKKAEAEKKKEEEQMKQVLANVQKRKEAEQKWNTR